MFLRSWHFSIAAAMLIVSGSCAQALADDVSLDNLTLPIKGGGTAAIRHVEFDGTNLTRDEVAEIFSGTATRAELAPIIAKLQADKVLIPEVVVTGDPETGSLTFHDFQATNINAGKVAHMSLAGFDGSGVVPEAGPVTLHSGQMTLDGGDFSGPLLALRSGDLASLSPAQIGNFTWAGFSMTFPDKDTPTTAAGGNLYKLSIASVDGQSSYTGTGDLSRTGSGELKNLVLEPPKASQFGRSLAEFGYDRIDLSFTVSGSYDADAKTYVLDKYTIDGADAGSLDFKARFGNIDQSAFIGDRKSRLAALSAGNVASAALSFADNGLFEKAVAFVAKNQKTTPSAIKQQWSALATELLPVMLGGDPAALNLASAVAKFIAAPKTLTITAKAKGDPLPFNDITTQSPALLLQRVDLNATAQ